MNKTKSKNPNWKDLLKTSSKKTIPRREQKRKRSGYVPRRPGVHLRDPIQFGERFSRESDGKRGQKVRYGTVKGWGVVPFYAILKVPVPRVAHSSADGSENYDEGSSCSGVHTQVCDLSFVSLPKGKHWQRTTSFSLFFFFLFFFKLNLGIKPHLYTLLM